MSDQADDWGEIDFVDAQAMAREWADTFEAPDEESITDGERFWTVIRDIKENGTLIAKVDKGGWLWGPHRI